MERFIEVSSVYNVPDRTIIIRRDNKWPGQIFVRFPVAASLTAEEVYALTDALVDTIEEVQEQ